MYSVLNQRNSKSFTGFIKFSESFVSNILWDKEMVGQSMMIAHILNRVYNYSRARENNSPKGYFSAAPIGGGGRGVTPQLKIQFFFSQLIIFT